MRPASAHISTRSTALCVVIVALLLCAASIGLIERDAPGPLAVEVPIWFNTTLTVRSVLPSSCRPGPHCSSRHTTRPGVSVWLTRVTITGQELPFRNRTSYLTMRRLVAISFD
jgi:hypothetical protein